MSPIMDTNISALTVHQIQTTFGLPHNPFGDHAHYPKEMSPH